MYKKSESMCTLFIQISYDKKRSHSAPVPRFSRLVRPVFSALPFRPSDEKNARIRVKLIYMILSAKPPSRILSRVPAGPNVLIRESAHSDLSPKGSAAGAAPQGSAAQKGIYAIKERGNHYADD